MIEFLKVITVVAGFSAHYKAPTLSYPPESIKHLLTHVLPKLFYNFQESDSDLRLTIPLFRISGLSAQSNAIFLGQQRVCFPNL